MSDRAIIFWTDPEPEAGLNGEQGEVSIGLLDEERATFADDAREVFARLWGVKPARVHWRIEDAEPARPRAEVEAQARSYEQGLADGAAEARAVCVRIARGFGAEAVAAKIRTYHDATILLGGKPMTAYRFGDEVLMPEELAAQIALSEEILAELLCEERTAQAVLPVLAWLFGLTPSAPSDP